MKKTQIKKPSQLCYETASFWLKTDWLQYVIILQTDLKYFLLRLERMKPISLLFFRIIIKYLRIHFLLIILEI